MVEKYYLIWAFSLWAPSSVMEIVLVIFFDTNSMRLTLFSSKARKVFQFWQKNSIWRISIIKQQLGFKTTATDQKQYVDFWIDISLRPGVSFPCNSEVSKCNAFWWRLQYIDHWHCHAVNKYIWKLSLHDYFIWAVGGSQYPYSFVKLLL